MNALAEVVEIPVGSVGLPGILTLPPSPTGLIIFALGSRRVAETLLAANFGTLLFDNVFDIGLLAGRLSAVATWAAREPATFELPIGLFGSRSGAAAALVAAAGAPRTVAAVVARGSQPYLAGVALEQVRAPTLLIVGSRDLERLALSRGALARLGGVNELAIEEPGALQAFADLATQWFTRHMPARRD